VLQLWKPGIRPGCHLSALLFCSSWCFALSHALSHRGNSHLTFPAAAAVLTHCTTPPPDPQNTTEPSTVCLPSAPPAAAGHLHLRLPGHCQRGRPRCPVCGRVGAHVHVCLSCPGDSFQPGVDQEVRGTSVTFEMGDTSQYEAEWLIRRRWGGAEAFCCGPEDGSRRFKAPLRDIGSRCVTWACKTTPGSTEERGHIIQYRMDQEVWRTSVAGVWVWPQGGVQGRVHTHLPGTCVLAPAAMLGCGTWLCG
jgi:hypothetical protein